MSTGPVLFPPEVDVPELLDGELAEDVRMAQGRLRREYARELEAVAQLAHRRHRVRELGTAAGRGGPGVDARALTDRVLDGVREDFVAELALIRNCSENEASAVLREALLLTGPMSATWSHLFDGHVSVAQAKAVADLLGDATPEVAAAVQARVLPKAEGMTAAGFRDRLRYHLYRADAEARERRRRDALTRVGVWVRRVDEGVSELVVQGPTPALHGAYDTVDALARMRRADGDTRPMGVLRAETATDLMLRPWDTSRPAITAQLVLHASAPSLRPDGDPAQTQEPGELDGTVVSAAECRDLLADLGELDLLVAVDDRATGQTRAVATLAEVARGARGLGLRPPPDTDAYEPSTAQQRFLGVRDRRCRMPGCRRRPGRARTDLDHGDPYESGGPTACWNLCCLCERHHRIKTFARDWSFHLARDGTLVVRTPSGVIRQTRPPGWYPDPEPDPPWLDEQAPPDPMRC
jgi:hypothetical protein